MIPHVFLTLALTLSLIALSYAQHPGGGGGAGGRVHTANESHPLRLIPADTNPPEEPVVSIEFEDTERHITSNGMPNHKIGKFPNRSNPNSISTQDYNVDLNAEPEPAKKITSVNRNDQPGPPNLPFGFAINGIFFEPGTAEFWMGDRSSGWNYEALGGAVPLGLDANYGHVQPNGAYHYHGLPTGLLDELEFSKDKHSPLVGWAADGYPIYALYGYKDPKAPDSNIVELRSSYQLKKGDRPGGDDGPGGKYDGAFTQDYEYVEGLGDLDECNGRFTVTPQFPEGTYAYFLTEEWPVIPRNFRADPVNIKARDARGPARGTGPRTPRKK